MNCREAVFSFISDPGLPALLLFFYSQLPGHFQEEPGGWHCAVYVCHVCARFFFQDVLLRNFALCGFLDSDSEENGRLARCQIDKASHVGRLARICLAPVGKFYDYLDLLISTGHLKVLSLDYSISRIALKCAKEYRLLPRDAIHAAYCDAYGIREMATNDSDFKHVSFLTLWNP
jgi:predicted nucleic acid-binding protein